MLSPFQKALVATIVATGLVIALVVAARGPGLAATVPSITVAPGNGGIAPGIVTVGDATVKMKPDIAILTVGATAQAATAAEAQALVADRMGRILAQAKTLGIAEKDTKTASYHIEPRYAYDKGEAPRITGYQATQLVALTLRKVDDAGKALDALVRNDGATNASIRFALDDTKPPQAEARTLAIGDARSKAEAMARTAGVRLGKVLSISDTGSSAPPSSERHAFSAPAPKADTQIPVGDLEVVVRVQVQFAIE